MNVSPTNTASARRAGGRRPLLGLALLAAVTAPSWGCAGAPAPAAGQARGSVPSLLGRSVIVFPVQRNLGVRGDATAEMVFALEGPGEGPDWLLPAELERVLAQSPGLDAPLENLPVDVFLQAQVNRIGDPIYGVLRRIGAVTDADLALLPVAVRPGVPAEPEDGAAAAEEGPVPVEFVATLIEVRTGRVVWFGVEAGAAGAADDPGRLASAAEALARRLVPPRTMRDAPRLEPLR